MQHAGKHQEGSVFFWRQVSIFPHLIGSRSFKTVAHFLFQLMSFACQQSDSQDAILAFGMDQQIEAFYVDQLVRIPGKFCIADSGISKRPDRMSRYLIYLMMGL